MREAAVGFKTRLSDEVASLVRLVTLTPKGNTSPFNLTDSDTKVTATINTVVTDFLPTEGFEASAVAVESGGGMQGLTIAFALSRDEVSGITQSKIDAGVLDSAKFVIYGYNRLGLTGDGPVVLYSGVVGTIDYDDDNNASLDIVSITKGRTDQIKVETYSKMCRATFCDTRCKLPLPDYKFAFTAENVASERDRITATSFNQPAPAFQDSFWSSGVIEFTTGKNAGIISEISLHTLNDVFLFIQLPYPILTGDEGFIYRGCNKLFDTCKGYGNTINFRGEPFDLFLPSIQEIEETQTRLVDTVVKDIVITDELERIY